MIRFELLQEFVNLTGCSSISEASRKMGMPPQTLNRHITEMEKELKCRLVERSVPLRLTAVGRRLYAGSEALLQSYANTVKDIEEMRRSVSETLRVFVYYPSPFRDLMWRAVDLLKVDYPGIVLKLVEKSPLSPFEAIEKGEAEAAMCMYIGDGFQMDSKYHHVIIKQELDYLRFGIPKDHPLEKVDPLTLEDLDGETLLLPIAGANSPNPTAICDYFKRQGMHIKTKCIDAANLSEFFLYAGDRGIYPFFKNYYKILDTPKGFQERVTERKVDGPPLKYTYCMITDAKRQDPAIAAFVDALEKSIE